MRLTEAIDVDDVSGYGEVVVASHAGHWGVDVGVAVVARLFSPRKAIWKRVVRQEMRRCV